MKWSLFLLSLMGQCFLSTCRLYEYHYIDEDKTWSEAQSYCRENYTDLATVYDMTDMTDMKRLLKSTENKGEAWIGLYSNPGKENRTWNWSLPGVKYNESEAKWGRGEPNDHEGKLENCVQMNNSKKWLDFPCTAQQKFICYNETNQSNKFHLINITKTWPQAENYCREHHTDLISGVHQLEEFKTDIGSYDKVWIGLFRDTWRWSNGSSFSFRHWDHDSFDKQQNKKNCALTKLNEKGRWKFESCNERKPFFCYDDKVILINQSKTWVEALYYCRENHYDLVSITNLNEQRWVQERAKKANTSYVWLGLRYTCALDFWFWVNDEAVRYKNWASDGVMDDCDMSGAMDTGGQHKWFRKPDNETFNFICSKF